MDTREWDHYDKLKGMPANEEENLPTQGQWVQWKKEPCPNCGDWLFCNGIILRCDCGKEFEIAITK